MMDGMEGFGGRESFVRRFEEVEGYAEIWRRCLDLSLGREYSGFKNLLVQIGNFRSETAK